MEVVQLLELSKAGVAGIMLALIGLIFVVMKYYHTLTTNHINHSNDIFNRSIEVQTRLVDSIDELRDEIKCLSQNR
jgi:hypothetical protein